MRDASMQTSGNRKEPSLASKPHGIQLPSKVFPTYREPVLPYVMKKNDHLLREIRRLSYLYKLLKTGEIVDTIQFEPISRIPKEATQSHFCFTTILFVKTASWNVGNTQRGSSTPCSLLSRLDTSDDHLFASMGHAIAEQSFSLYEKNIKKWLNEYLLQKWKIFTGVVFIDCPKDGENV